MTPGEGKSIALDLVGFHHGQCGPGSDPGTDCPSCRAHDMVEKFFEQNSWDRMDRNAVWTIVGWLETFPPGYAPPLPAPSSDPRQLRFAGFPSDSVYLVPPDPPDGTPAQMVDQLRSRMDSALRVGRWYRLDERLGDHLRWALATAPPEAVEDFRLAYVASWIAGWPECSRAIRVALGVLLRAARPSNRVERWRGEKRRADLTSQDEIVLLIVGRTFDDKTPGPRYAGDDPFDVVDIKDIPF